MLAAFWSPSNKRRQHVRHMVLNTIEKKHIVYKYTLFHINLSFLGIKYGRAYVNITGKLPYCIKTYNFFAELLILC